MPIYIPPNGLAGFAQQTPAVQSMGQRRGGARRSKSRVRSVKLTGIKTRRKRAGGKTSKANTSVYARRRKKKGATLVKGSAAAKRRMAQLRKMRRK